MSFHLAHAGVPFLNVNIVFVTTCNDIDNAEAVTWTYGYILGHLESRQHVSQFSLCDEENLVEVVSICKDKILLFEIFRFE